MISLSYLTNRNSSSVNSTHLTSNVTSHYSRPSNTFPLPPRVFSLSGVVPSSVLWEGDSTVNLTVRQPLIDTYVYKESLPRQVSSSSVDTYDPPDVCHPTVTSLDTPPVPSSSTTPAPATVPCVLEGRVSVKYR